MQITELAAKVQTLGLSDKEARVYVAALFLGPSAVQKIAEQANINRATAYVILDQLAELGLVAQSTEGKKTVFVAEGPETLQRLFDHQAEAIEARRKELIALLPELQQSQRTDTDKTPMVRFYKGREGIKTAISELQRKAPPNSQSYGLVNFDEVEKIDPDIIKSSPRTRIKKQISRKTIYSYRKEVPSNPKLLLETMKVQEPIKADVTLYENIASLSSYGGKETVGIIIESQQIVEVLRQLFELAWKNNQD